MSYVAKMLRERDKGSEGGVSMTSMSPSRESHAASSTKDGYGLNRRSVYKDVEAGSDVPRFSTALALQDESASDCHAGDEDDACIEDTASKYAMKLVNIFNFVLFGNGHYKFLPIAWVCFALSIVIYLHVEFIIMVRNTTYASYLDPFVYLTFFVGTISNIHFGWRFSKSGLSVERTIRDCCKTFEARNKARQQLEWVTRLTFLVFFLFYALYCTSPGINQSLKIERFDQVELGLSSSLFPIIMFVVCLMSGYIYYLSTFFVASIWIWKCWLKKNVIAAIAEGIRYETLMDDTCMDEFEEGK